MSETQPSQDPRVLALRESLSDIGRTVQTLRERVRRLDRPGAPSGEASPVAATEVEQTALRAFQDALAIPSSGLEPGQLFDMAVDRVARLAGADRVMLLLYDPATGRLAPHAARGFRRGDLGEVSLAPGEGLVGRAFVEGRGLAYAPPPDAAPADPFVARYPVGSALAAPIRAAAEVMGVLYAGRRSPGGAFTADQTLGVHLVADRIATNLAHHRVAGALGGHLARLRELERFSSRAVVGRDLKEILRQACEAGCLLLGVRVAAIGIAGPADDMVLVAAANVPSGTEWRAHRRYGLTGETFSSGRPVMCRDVRERPQGEAVLEDLGLRACLLVPLRTGEATAGVLYLADPRVREFSAEEVQTAQVLASLAALAVENDRLYGEVRVAFNQVTTTQERLIHTEKARALGEMAAGVAHEFNNILAIILGKTQLLMPRVSEEAVREGLGTIEEAAWRAADIVRRLQGFAATNMEDATGVVDINTLVHDAVTLTRALWKDEAEARGVRIEVLSELGDLPPVHGNAATLREAITNLVLNAIDAMPRGGRLGLTTTSREGGVELRVQDTGEGMSPEVRRRIFDPFFSTRTPLRTGLGLSVVLGIVSRHRGRIEVESEEGRGTTVTVWLPGIQAPGAPGSGVGAPGAEASPPAKATGASVLVLEDEERIRTMLVESLSQAGHTVEAAADGLTGLARFQGGHFDVVLTDLSLPERSGLEVARAVKRMNPDTPVVLITGWGHLLDPARLRESGVDLMLVKPFRLERVLSVLAEALRLSRPS